jgi:hypothetical protein
MIKTHIKMLDADWDFAGAQPQPGQHYVILSLAAGKVRIVRSYERQIKKSSRIFCNPNRNNEYRL